jgi:CheY-like chemotaxis protein
MLRIALIEDSHSDAELLRMALDSVGEPISITHFDDGRHAIRELMDHRREFDLLLLDLNLPGFNGLEVLQRLKGDDRTRSLPVVVMSGSNAPVDIEQSYAFGASSYICKPVHLDDVFVMAGHLVSYWAKCVERPTSVAGDLRTAAVGTP